MTYREWLEKNAPIDKLVAAALPPPAELDKLSFDAIIATHGDTIVHTAKARGINLTDTEVEEIVYRLYGVEDVEPFTRADYDRHC